MKITEKGHKIIREGKATKHDSVFITEYYEPETFQEVVELHDFGRHIDGLDKDSEHILTKAGLWPYSDANALRVAAAIETQKLAVEDSVQYFAAGVLQWICNLRDALRDGNARKAAIAAYWIADNKRMAWIAATELPIVVGRKSCAGGVNPANAKLRDDAMERNAPMLKNAQRKKSRNPAETDASIVRVALRIDLDEDLSDEPKLAKTRKLTIDRHRKRLQRAKKRSPDA